MIKRRGCFCGQKVYDWLVKEVSINKDRLIARLSRNLVDDEGCKIWAPTGSGTKAGYGRLSVWFDGKIDKLYIHHVFWTLVHQRPIPDGMEIDHTCEKRRCVKHLELVTVQQNIDFANGKQTRTA